MAWLAGLAGLERNSVLDAEKLFDEIVDLVAQREVVRVVDVAHLCYGLFFLIQLEFGVVLQSFWQLEGRGQLVVEDVLEELQLFFPLSCIGLVQVLQLFQTHDRQQTGVQLEHAGILEAVELGFEVVEHRLQLIQDLGDHALGLVTVFDERLIEGQPHNVVVVPEVGDGGVCADVNVFDQAFRPLQEARQRLPPVVYLQIELDQVYHLLVGVVGLDEYLRGEDLHNS